MIENESDQGNQPEMGSREVFDILNENFPYDELLHPLSSLTGDVVSIGDHLFIQNSKYATRFGFSVRNRKEELGVYNIDVAHVDRFVIRTSYNGRNPWTGELSHYNMVGPGCALRKNYSENVKV